MELRYAVLCDYAQPGNMGKPTVVGIYDALYAPKDRSIATSPAFLHTRIDCPSAAGPKHVMTHRLIDGDAKTIFEEDAGLAFTVSPVHPERQFAYTYAFVHPIELPGIGDYEWVILIDGIRLGSVPFTIMYFPDSMQVAP